MGCSRLLALPQSSASGAAFETLDLIKQHLSLKHRDLKSSLHVTAVSRCELWFCYFLLCYEVRSSSVMSYFLLYPFVHSLTLTCALSVNHPLCVEVLVLPSLLLRLFSFPDSAVLFCPHVSPFHFFFRCVVLDFFVCESSSYSWFAIYTFFFFFCFFSWITCF